MSAVFGKVREIWRRVQEVGKPIIRGIAGAGTFVLRHHAPIASLLKAAGDASGNETFQKVGNGALAASGLLTGAERFVSNRIAQMRQAQAAPARTWQYPNT